MSGQSVERKPYPHAAVRPDWLNGLREDILEPELPIVDPHHHLWHRRPDRYLLEDLLADVGSGHNVRSTVFIQCGSAYRTEGAPELRPVGETEFVAAIAAETETGAHGAFRACSGIIGYADFRLGEKVDAVLEAHIQAGGGRFKGIRQSATFNPNIAPTGSVAAPEHLYMDPAFRRGLARMSRFGLSFEAWLYHPQLQELIDLARAFPDLPMVINHFGGPLGVGPYRGKRQEIFGEWRAGMQELAKSPNLHVKLGGLAMVVNGFDFHEQVLPPSSGEMANAWRPYVETCIEAFGARRCMFESNFPVDKGMCSYPVLWNAFKRLASGCSVDEKAALFHGTAITFYRLPAIG